MPDRPSRSGPVGRGSPKPTQGSHTEGYSPRCRKVYAPGTPRTSLPPFPRRPWGGRRLASQRYLPARGVPVKVLAVVGVEESGDFRQDMRDQPRQPRPLCEPLRCVLSLLTSGAVSAFISVSVLLKALSMSSSPGAEERSVSPLRTSFLCVLPTPGIGACMCVILIAYNRARGLSLISTYVVCLVCVYINLLKRRNELEVLKYGIVRSGNEEGRQRYRGEFRREQFKHTTHNMRMQHIQELARLFVEEATFIL